VALNTITITHFDISCLLVEYLGLCYCVNISLYFLIILEIDRAFKQFVFECMDWSSTDPNGFIMTRDSEGMVHSAIPWDDPYPFFKGMIPHHLKSVLKDPMSSTPSEERSGNEISLTVKRLLVSGCMWVVSLVKE
jgi:hypothetical protein